MEVISVMSYVALHSSSQGVQDLPHIFINMIFRSNLHNKCYPGIIKYGLLQIPAPVCLWL